MLLLTLHFSEANGVVRIANQGLPGSVSDSGEVELECSVTTYVRSKEDGTLSSPGACTTVCSLSRNEVEIS